MPFAQTPDSKFFSVDSISPNNLFGSCRGTARFATKRLCVWNAWYQSMISTLIIWPAATGAP
jgi:hypothetical protein